MSKSDKHRYWLFEVYPESAPEDWLQQLKETHCPFAISPLHEPDEQDSKPHHHGIFYSPGPITWQNAKNIIPELVPANGHIEWAKSPSGSQRYLIHLDDLEKQQFPEGPRGITILNGFPLDLTRELSRAEKRELRNRVHDFVRQFDIVEYSELLDALQSLDVDMYDYACNHTILFNTYITSRRNAKHDSQE